MKKERHLPTHGGDETWIKVVHPDSLLGHSPELLTQRIGKLGNEEPTEDGSDCPEHSDVDDALDVLLDHVAHHVWVLHHARHLVELHLFLEVTCLRSAEEGFPLLYRIFREEV